MPGSSRTPWRMVTRGAVVSPMRTEQTGGTPTSGPHTCARRRILLVRSEQEPLNVMTEPRIARRKPRSLLRRKTRYISVLYPQRNLEHVRILFVALVNIERNLHFVIPARLNVRSHNTSHNSRRPREVDLVESRKLR